MRLLREAVLAILLLGTCHGASHHFKKKEGLKRAVETYSYPVPTERFDENPGKNKVIVETIKSISPSEYLSPTGYVGSTIEASTATGKIPVGTVTFNAFEPDNSKKPTTVSFVNTETAAPAKKKSGYKYYTGGITGSSQKPTNSPSQIPSTNNPAPVRITSVEPATTLLPGYQYNSPSTNFQQPSASAETSAPEKAYKIIPTRGKSDGGRYNPQKIKKPIKGDGKLSDSKPEETGFNGYHYDVGSLSFESKHTGSQGGGGGGMMGASYMRSSSPFYNYHVMLD